MKFSKAHAYGNDFLYVERSDVAQAALDRLAREMCDRHTGIGADGLIVYEQAPTPCRCGCSTPTAAARRCPATASGRSRRSFSDTTTAATSPLTIHTEAGAKHLSRIGRRRHAGRRSARRWEVRSALAGSTLDAAGESLELVVLNIGNPQCVLLGSLPDEARFRRLGAALERHPAFPEGTNVEFADVESPARVRILIWERGVGPTTSSGTGSCAALVAAAAYGGADREADVSRRAALSASNGGPTAST